MAKFILDAFSKLENGSFLLRFWLGESSLTVGVNVLPLSMGTYDGHLVQFDDNPFWSRLRAGEPTPEPEQLRRLVMRIYNGEALTLPIEIEQTTAARRTVDHA